jgi:hypothetical protein
LRPKIRGPLFQPLLGNDNGKFGQFNLFISAQSQLRGTFAIALQQSSLKEDYSCGSRVQSRDDKYAKGEEKFRVTAYLFDDDFPRHADRIFPHDEISNHKVA